MITNILLCGVGGQGTVLAAKLLARMFAAHQQAQCALQGGLLARLAASARR